ncbi:MAG TPA: amino acid ABC transporter substrate-binding protein [Alphaproteobacteria bacterium]|nr:amino acid ABC transporter substrate-binding protein [Alphaproteobacteria bacterium]
MSGPLGTLARGLLLAVLTWASAVAAPPSKRLEQIESRGYLVCGIEPGIAGFAIDRGGRRFAGFDIDICRAVAAAILGNADKVRFVRVETVKQFLQSPDIDLVARRLTWTLTREGGNGLLFGPITFYDGQGFMVPNNRGVTKPEDLAGQAICVQAGEGQEANLARWATRKGLAIREIVFTSQVEIERAVFDGRCAAYSADITMLASERLRAPNPDDWAILSEMISKEPLAPLIRAGDDGFFEIVRWTIFALIDAEELGVSSHNVAAMRTTSTDPNVRSLLGLVPGTGKALGLREGWVSDVIGQVGNYGEMFDRNVGSGSPVHLDRRLNNLWTQGGLLYAPPFR